MIPANVESIGAYAFQDCTFDGELTLSSLKLKEIKEYTFCSSGRFTGKLVLSLNVEKIGDHAFESCSGFSGLTLNENLLSIGQYAFSGCSGFEGNLVIPDKVQTIGEKAFYNCRKFDGLLIFGRAVQSLGKDAFYYYYTGNSGCLPFKKIYFKGKTPPVFVPASYSAFGGGTLKYIGVPIGSKEGYLKLLWSYKIDVIEEIEF